MSKPVSTPRVKAYYMRLRVKLVALLGGKCCKCGALTPLEFAHLEPTSLKGSSRGRNRRLRDVMGHLSSYCLMCDVCHDVFDGRPVRSRSSAPLPAGGESDFTLPSGGPEVGERFFPKGEIVLNKVMLIGRLGADPELKYIPSGKTVGDGYHAGKESDTQGGGGPATEPPLTVNPPVLPPFDPDEIPF